MAILESQKLSIEITNIVSYLMDKKHEWPTYEQFDIQININNQPAIHEVNRQYELCDGNIPILISKITEVLDSPFGCEREIEFTEPDFRFEIKRDHFQDAFGEWHDMFILICWVNSGQWNGIYSDTEIGVKFNVGREELRKFKDELQQEWNKRIVCMYEKRDKYKKIKMMFHWEVK